MNNTTLDYALMAGEAYFYKRIEPNQFPVPLGASLLPGGLEGRQLPSGFEARAYDYQGKIVISFAGTYFPNQFLGGLRECSVNENDQAGLKDWVANVQLGYGGLDGQLRDAALYYQQIKIANPGKEIVFTGHSLGGGVAALMGVLFNREAFTFDPAPFRNAATEWNATKLYAYLKSQGYRDDQLGELYSFTATQAPLASVYPEILAGLALTSVGVGGPLGLFVTGVLAASPVPVIIRGEEKIKAIAVAGEFLTGNDFNDFRNRLRIMGGGTELVDQGSIGKIAGGDAHSITLLYLLGKSSSFQQLTKDYAGLLPLLFARKLYAYSPDTPNRNFLETILRQELAVTGITPTSASTGFLGKFVADTRKLVGTHGMTGQAAVQKALTVAAMEYYYFKDANSATALFTNEGNALHFKYSDIGAAIYKSLPLLADAIKPFIAESAQNAQSIQAQLLKQDAWHIQSGTSGINWSATAADNDAVIGGAQTDIIDAGAGKDIILGGAGADFLTGGAGDDLLLGGQGNDTYVFSGQFDHDTLTDSDGQGTLQLNGTAITGTFKGIGKRGAYGLKHTDGTGVGISIYNDASSSTGKSAVLRFSGSDANQITIKNFDEAAAKGGQGYLCIKIAPEQSIVIKASDCTTEGNPFKALDFDPNTFAAGAVGRQLGAQAVTTNSIALCAVSTRARGRFCVKTRSCKSNLRLI